MNFLVSCWVLSISFYTNLRFSAGDFSELIIVFQIWIITYDGQLMRARPIFQFRAEPKNIFQKFDFSRSSWISAQVWRRLRKIDLVRNSESNSDELNRSVTNFDEKRYVCLNYFRTFGQMMIKKKQTQWIRENCHVWLLGGS